MLSWAIHSAILSRTADAFSSTPTPLSKCWMLSMYWLSHTFCWPGRDLNRCSALGGQVLCWIQNSELETNLQPPCSSHLSLVHVNLTRPLKSGKGRHTHQSLQHRCPYAARDQLAVASMEAKCEIRCLSQHFLSYLVRGLCCPWGFLHLSHWNQKQRHHTVSGWQRMANSLLPLNLSFLPPFLNSVPETYAVVDLQDVPI